MNPETLNDRYAEAREKITEIEAKILFQEPHVAELKAVREGTYIDQQGGMKNIGSNEDERKRNLLRWLSDDDIYTAEASILRQYQRDLLFAQSKLDSIKFEMRLYEASLKKAELDAITYFELH